MARTWKTQLNLALWYWGLGFTVNHIIDEWAIEIHVGPLWILIEYGNRSKQPSTKLVETRKLVEKIGRAYTKKDE